MERGGNLFAPGDRATRAEAAVILFRMLVHLDELQESPADSIVGSETVTEKRKSV